MATQLKEPEPVMDEPETTDAPDNAAVEAEARKMGWRPEEEWPEDKPKPPSFKSAEDFVRLSEEKAGLQKQTIAHLREEVSFLKRQTRKLMESEQNAHINALEEIRREMKEAVRTGDEEAFEALDRKADKLRKNMDAGTSSNEDPTEHVLKFREDNAWYDRAALATASEAEVEARLYADRLADKWIAEGRPQAMPPSQFYAELAEEVNQRFPMLKAKPVRQKPPSDVAAPTARSAKPATAPLTAEEKITAERYMRIKLPGFTKCKTKDEAYKLFAELQKE